MKLFRTKNNPPPLASWETDEEEAEGDATQDKQRETIVVKEEKSGEKKISPEESRPEDWFEPEGELAIDVYQTEKDIVVQAAIAGVRPDEMDVAIENDVVTIRGVRRNPNDEDKKQYFHEECFWGPFSRQVFLPEEVNLKDAQASMKEGIFTLRLPKAEQEKTKKVKVAKK